MNSENIKIYFLISIVAIGCILKSLSSDKENKKLQGQIDELRLLFNQKFLQEMVVNKPVVRFEF
jgi:hypothetical protein